MPPTPALSYKCPLSPPHAPPRTAADRVPPGPAPGQVGQLQEDPVIRRGVPLRL